MKNYFNNVKNILEKYSNLGISHLEDETTLIGKAPHIAPKAWLHKLYKPLTFEEIERLQNELCCEIPIDYKLFLTTHSNGLKVFVDTLSLDGLRKINSRNIENAYQPYSIITPNVDERISDAKDDMFFIGGYNWDGSLLYMQNNKIYRCSRHSTLPLNKWDSFSQMLLSEIERLCLLHDDKGQEIIIDAPTIPLV